MGSGGSGPRSPLDTRAGRPDERGGRDRPARRSQARRAQSQRRSTRSRRVCSRAAGSSTSGPGTSGRLAVVDAAECESTFSAPPGLVTALIAGGAASAATAQEHAEDDAGEGERELQRLELGPNDAVVGLSASGRTPYVVGALSEAARAGALTVAVVSVDGSELGRLAEHEIAVVVGAEVISGSTRLKAGTAQKLVLNMISTITMVRLGKTYGNLMVDVVATNEKLRARVRRIVATATGEPDERGRRGARRGGRGRARRDRLAARRGSTPTTARARLAAAGGVVRKALAP